MWFDRLKPPRTQPRPDGAFRLWVEQLDCRCLPFGGLADVSFAVGHSFLGVGAENLLVPSQPFLPPVPVPPSSDVMTGGDVFLPPPPVTLYPEPMPQPDGGGGGPMGGFDPGSGVVPGSGVHEPVTVVIPDPPASELVIVLPSPTFDGPLLAMPEHAAIGRTATVDWGDGVITDAVFAPGVDGWLAVRVNRVLDGNATYHVNVRLTAADDPKDWLDIPLQVLTPPAPATDGFSTWNATGYSPPVPVEVEPSEWLWVSLPVFESADLEPTLPGGGGFTLPPPASPVEPPNPNPDVTQIPPPGAGPALPTAPPTDPTATPAGPFTSPPGGAAVPINPPVVHPASYSPFEAGATRAALASTPAGTPKTPPPPPDPVVSPTDTRSTDSRGDEKPTADPSPIASSTPEEPPESWDWVVALGVGPLELAAGPAPTRAARASRSEGASERGEKDGDSNAAATSRTPQGGPHSRDAAPSDAGSDDFWITSPEADRLRNLFDAPIVRQPAHNADGSPEAILAALADAPAPDAVFVDAPTAAESPGDREERWGWQSGAMALVAAVWAGVWFLWPRLGQWVRPVDPAAVVPDVPTLTRFEVARPAAPRSAELVVEAVANS